MKFIIGKKIEMSQKFAEDGTVIPVTLVFAPPMEIVQVKNKEKDGYNAIQLGSFPKKKINKALKGHLKDMELYGTLREVRVDEIEEGFERGKKISIDQFEVGSKVNITGVSKGKGFQGVVKRHKFHGGPASHGHKDQLRMPGSIGAKGVARVFKGTRMAGRMGNDKTTIKNLEIVEIDKEKNIIAVKGALPGARNSFIYIQAK